MAEIQKYDHYRIGLNKAIQYLSYKKRTEKEVIQYLQKEEISEQAISEVIEYCYREKVNRPSRLCGKFKKYNDSHDR
ncbi:Regulatory protein recX [Staphylococcus aureus]|uniref:Regulatory protein recX n=1 Tax=Staphylococcus aureus TaxID=1280 RepID=A0A380E5U1_STAAU|nr:Regulatory protein recX [Staphylococcus aureus]